jgi:hypothetical protein
MPVIGILAQESYRHNFNHLLHHLICYEIHKLQRNDSDMNIQLDQFPLFCKLDGNLPSTMHLSLVLCWLLSGRMVCGSLPTTEEHFGATVLSLGTLLFEILGEGATCDLCRRSSHWSPYW